MFPFYDCLIDLLDAYAVPQNCVLCLRPFVVFNAGREIGGHEEAAALSNSATTP